jgi:hypothetical protein
MMSDEWRVESEKGGFPRLALSTFGFLLSTFLIQAGRHTLPETPPGRQTPLENPTTSIDMSSGMAR